MGSPCLGLSSPELAWLAPCPVPRNPKGLPLTHLTQPWAEQVSQGWWPQLALWLTPGFAPVPARCVPQCERAPQYVHVPGGGSYVICVGIILWALEGTSHSALCLCLLGLARGFALCQSLGHFMGWSPGLPLLHLCFFCVWPQV